eukprot:00474_3
MRCQAQAAETSQSPPDLQEYRTQQSMAQVRGHRGTRSLVLRRRSRCGCSCRSLGFLFQRYFHH